MSLNKRIASFGFAFKGIALVWKGTNFRIQFVLMLLALILAYLLEFSTLEWVMVLGVSALVLSAEAFNTAIEYIVDFISPEHHPVAGKIKDIAAGAVLITALFAALIGAILYLPKLISYVL